MAAAPLTPATGKSPTDIICGANIFKTSCEIPLNETGVAIGWKVCPATCASEEFVATPERIELETIAWRGSSGFQFVAANSANETARGSRAFVLTDCFCSK